MEYIGGYGPRCFKILAIILWGTHVVDYIRRNGNRFQVKTRPLGAKFRVAGHAILSDFRALESMGYICSLRVEVGRVNFNLNLPRWLQVTEAAKELELDVPGRHDENL